MWVCIMCDRRQGPGGSTIERKRRRWAPGSERGAGFKGGRGWLGKGGSRWGEVCVQYSPGGRGLSHVQAGVLGSLPSCRLQLTLLP